MSHQSPNKSPNNGNDNDNDNDNTDNHSDKNGSDQIMEETMGSENNEESILVLHLFDGFDNNVMHLFDEKSKAALPLQIQKPETGQMVTKSPKPYENKAVNRKPRSKLKKISCRQELLEAGSGPTDSQNSETMDSTLGAADTSTEPENPNLISILTREYFANAEQTNGSLSSQIPDNLGNINAEDTPTPTSDNIENGFFEIKLEETSRQRGTKGSSGYYNLESGLSNEHLSSNFGNDSVEFSASQYSHYFENMQIDRDDTTRFGPRNVMISGLPANNTSHIADNFDSEMMSPRYSDAVLELDEHHPTADQAIPGLEVYQDIATLSSISCENDSHQAVEIPHEPTEYSENFEGLDYRMISPSEYLPDEFLEVPHTTERLHQTSLQSSEQGGYFRNFRGKVLPNTEKLQETASIQDNTTTNRLQPSVADAPEILHEITETQSSETTISDLQLPDVSDILEVYGDIITDIETTEAPEGSTENEIPEIENQNRETISPSQYFTNYSTSKTIERLEETNEHENDNATTFPLTIADNSSAVTNDNEGSASVSEYLTSHIEEEMLQPLEESDGTNENESSATHFFLHAIDEFGRRRLLIYIEETKQIYLVSNKGEETRVGNKIPQLIQSERIHIFEVFDESNRLVRCEYDAETQTVYILTDTGEVEASERFEHEESKTPIMQTPEDSEDLDSFKNGVITPSRYHEIGFTTSQLPTTRRFSEISDIQESTPSTSRTDNIENAINQNTSPSKYFSDSFGVPETTHLPETSESIENRSRRYSEGESTLTASENPDNDSMGVHNSQNQDSVGSSGVRTSEAHSQVLEKYREHLRSFSKISWRILKKLCRDCRRKINCTSAADVMRLFVRLDFLRNLDGRCPSCSFEEKRRAKKEQVKHSFTLTPECPPPEEVDYDSLDIYGPQTVQQYFSSYTDASDHSMESSQPSSSNDSEKPSNSSEVTSPSSTVTKGRGNPIAETEVPMLSSAELQKQAEDGSEAIPSFVFDEHEDGAVCDFSKAEGKVPLAPQAFFDSVRRQSPARLIRVQIQGSYKRHWSVPADSVKPLSEKGNVQTYSPFAPGVRGGEDATNELKDKDKEYKKISKKTHKGGENKENEKQ